MNSVSFVIPALNEAENIPDVMSTIPRADLESWGWDTQVIVVDNGSIDGTDTVARGHGAQVVYQPARGYGNAYRAGFDRAVGSIIVTGDADCTYPFDHTPQLLKELLDRRLDFLNTNRLGRENNAAMLVSHRYANRFLSTVSRALLGSPFRDSQSGMWVFRREIWKHLDVPSPGMSFSQEIKNEAYMKGFACAEVPIEYRKRSGEVKLNAARDGFDNTVHLFRHRARRPAGSRPLISGSVGVDTLPRP